VSEDVTSLEKRVGMLETQMSQLADWMLAVNEGLLLWADFYQKWIKMCQKVQELQKQGDK